MSYNEQLNQLWEGKLDPKYTHIRIMQNTPEILIKHAGAKDKPVMMKRHSFELELFEEGPREGNYQGLGYDVMEKLPDMMSNPVLIYKRSDGRIIEISRYSSPEKNLLLSIELDSEFRYVGDNGESWGDFNIVITAFNPKDRYLKGQLSRDGNEFLYPTKKEDISSAMSGLFAYPGDNKDTSSIDNIPPINDGSQVLLSTRDSAGRDLSPEQQEFFKDSQVRDEQGNLLVVYHGTPNNFTVFSKELRGTNNKTVAGTKYFFAGDIETAESYSPYHVLKNLAVKMPGTFSLQDAEAAKGKGGVMPLYLLIKNPLVADLADYNWSEHREAGDALLEYIDEAERNGNDGLIFYNVPDNNLRPGERTSTIYLFKEPEQAKSIYNTTPTSDPDIRYSFRGYAPPMYSRLQMEIEALKDNTKLGADSVIAYLRKRGVKAEEIRWSGIQAFLQGKKSVTKAELMEFVQGNELRVEDVSSTAPIVFDINEAEET